MATEKTLTVPAIHCDHCVETIRKTLGEFPGLEAVEGDPEGKRVRIRFDESRVSMDEIEASLDAIGFSAEEAR